MIISIFSRFDPTWFNIYLKTLITTIIPLLTIITSFWLNLSPTIILASPIKSYIVPQIKKTKLTNLKRLAVIIVSVLTIILYTNILGILPYIFRMSSHIIITISLGLPLWILLIISRTNLSIKKTIAHLLPDRAPLWLNPFLVIIESIRLIVRPVTLRFRLAANITAGHIILSLISTFSSVPTAIKFLPIILLSNIYTIFELGICYVQAYIFCLLVSLYRNDHP